MVRGQPGEDTPSARKCVTCGEFRLSLGAGRGGQTRYAVAVAGRGPGQRLAVSQDWRGWGLQPGLPGQAS